MTKTGKLLTGCLMSIALATQLHAADCTVVNDNDTGAGSLRDCIDNVAGNGDKITFAGACSPGCTINVGAEMDVEDNITIDGENNAIVLDGGGTGRIFNFNGVTVTLSNLTMQNGDEGTGGAIRLDASEGAATLTINNCTFSGNSATNRGGAIGVTSDSHDAMLTINNCTFDDNHASSDGGAIATQPASDDSATVVINNSTFSGNRAEDDGGAIYNRAGASDSEITVSIQNSTLSGNEAGSDGGAIYGAASSDGDTRITVNNSTISGNDAGNRGGAIYAFESDGDTQITVNNSTISGNSAGSDGGGLFISDVDDAEIILRNTILAGNSASSNSPECNQFDSEDYNLIQDPTDCQITGDTGNNITDQDPLLGPLADNGGPTQTHALLNGSPAIDSADSLDTEGVVVNYDQRGTPRPQKAGWDIGAYEDDTVTRPVPALSHSGKVMMFLSLLFGGAWLARRKKA
ncbi:MAG: hypothetical protein JRK53_04770 [Deltaproteobacteria bacterium]|nr:hypothetical protein [Deltaproteobacteria bacterium]